MNKCTECTECSGFLFFSVPNDFFVKDDKYEKEYKTGAFTAFTASKVKKVNQKPYTKNILKCIKTFYKSYGFLVNKINLSNSLLCKICVLCTYYSKTENAFTVNVEM